VGQRRAGDQGGRFAGYGLYLKDGKPTFTMNLLDVERPKWQAPEALPPGKHSVVFDWKMDPQGLAVARGGTGTLLVDGKQVAQKPLPKTIPFVWAWDETSTWGSTPAPRWTMPTTRCRSPSPASSARLSSTLANRASRRRPSAP